MNTYHAVYERDDTGAWLVHIAEDEGCHTYGRTLTQARERITEALAAWLDQEPDEFELIEVHRMPDELRESVESMKYAQVAARQANERLESTRKQAIAQLIEAGLSMRDVAAVVGVSHQRVAQIHAVWRADQERYAQWARDFAARSDSAENGARAESKDEAPLR
jgi:predicted RNase H-like HicB family nuclease